METSRVSALFFDIRRFGPKFPNYRVRRKRCCVRIWAKRGSNAMSGTLETLQHAHQASAPTARTGLYGEPLESLTELNEQSLELLVEHAALPAAVHSPLLHALRDL